MSDFGQGASDVGRSALANIGDTYQAVLQGRLAPQATMIGDMERTTETELVGPPADTIGEGYEAAMREQEALEDTERQAQRDAEQRQAVDPEAGQPEPGIG